MMDQNGNGNISDDGDSFDKLDLSEVAESNEMDMKIVAEKITKLEAEMLAMKTAEVNRTQMLEKFGEMKNEINGMTMKEEMAAMKSELNDQIVGLAEENIELIMENGKLKEENEEKCRVMEKMKKQIEELKEEINKKIKVMEELEMENDEKLKEKERDKKEIEQLKMVIEEKDREYDELNEKCKKLKEQLTENECAPKEVEKNKTEIEDMLLQLEPKSKQRMRMVFESLRLASGESIELIDPIIEFGFINSLVKALNIQDQKIQHEAVWALTNIAAGNSVQTWTIVEANGIEPLLKMCTSESIALSEQALWAISNIAGDSAKCRDELIARGIVAALVKIAKRMNSSSTKGSFVCKLAWIIENLWRHKPPPSVDVNVLAQIIPPIVVLFKYKDIKCKIDACTAMALLTSDPKEIMWVALDLDFIPDMVYFIKSGEEKLIVPALRVLENFSKTDGNIFANARKRVHQCDCFFILLSLKHHKSNEIAKIAGTVLNKFFPKWGNRAMK